MATDPSEKVAVVLKGRRDAGRERQRQAAKELRSNREKLSRRTDEKALQANIMCVAHT